MKFLLSGSHGFLGQRIGNSLLFDGCEVRAIPRDLLYEEWNLKRFIESEQPDVILHFAAYGNHSTQTNMVDTIEANVLCTARLLEASKDVNYQAFINVSTSSVYLPTQTMYSETKKATEGICKLFAKQHDKPVVTVRPYSIYGPGEAESRFIPQIVLAAKCKSHLSIVLEPKHDWVFVDDFISAVKKVVNQARLLQGLSIDIGTGMEYSNKDVFDTLQRIHSRKIKHEVVESMRVYDNDSWVCDPTIINSLGWYPEHSLEDGLKVTYDYY